MVTCLHPRFPTGHTDSAAAGAWAPLYRTQVELSGSPGASESLNVMFLPGLGGRAFTAAPLFIVTSVVLPTSPARLLILALLLPRVIPAELLKPDSSVLGLAQQGPAVFNEKFCPERGTEASGHSSSPPSVGALAPRPSVLVQLRGKAVGLPLLQELWLGPQVSDRYWR